MRKPSMIMIMSVLLLSQTAPACWAWQMERPDIDIDIPDRVDSSISNGEVSVGLGVAIDDYDENAADYGGSDYVAMNVSMTANSRVGINYGCSVENLWRIYPEDLIPDSRLEFDLGDDDGRWVDIPQDWGPFAFRFYGGQYSAEYQKLWVCSNGFIAFDEREQSQYPSEYVSPTPANIPSNRVPNGIIAAVWTDLDVDVNSKIITGIYEDILADYEYFVVSWENVKHKQSGKRLTFQIILFNIYDYQTFRQSFIYISYINVGAITTDFAWGIENQQGSKGTGGLCSGSELQNFNGQSRVFTQNSNIFYLQGLTIKLEDTCSQTRFDIKEKPPAQVPRGYNILGGNLDPDPNLSFLKALAGTGVLLVDVWSPTGWIKGAAFIVGVTLVGLDWVDVLAYRQYSDRYVSVFDAEDQQVNWAEASAQTYLCVDASLSIFVHWILDDPNDQQHSLTITAEALYYDPENPSSSLTLATAVSLEITPDDNDSFSLADSLSEGQYSWLWLNRDTDPVDYYKVNVPPDRGIYVEMTALSPHTDFHLYIYNSSYTLWFSSELGSGQTERVYGTGPGDWYIKVYATPDHDFYSLKVVIRLIGDITGSAEGVPDGKVDIYDVALAARAFGSYPGHAKWNEIADINNDDKVNIYDIATIAKDFGETLT